MDKNVNVNFGGVLPALLTVLFVGLKLTGHIDWSWWWVLSPIWISVLLGVGFFVIAAIIVAAFR